MNKLAFAILISLATSALCIKVKHQNQGRENGYYPEGNEEPDNNSNQNSENPDGGNQESAFDLVKKCESVGNANASSEMVANYFDQVFKTMNDPAQEMILIRHEKLNEGENSHHKMLFRINNEEKKMVVYLGIKASVNAAGESQIIAYSQSPMLSELLSMMGFNDQKVFKYPCDNLRQSSSDALYQLVQIYGSNSGQDTNSNGGDVDAQTDNTDNGATDYQNNNTDDDATDYQYNNTDDGATDYQYNNTDDGATDYQTTNDYQTDYSTTDGTSVTSNVSSDNIMIGLSVNSKPNAINYTGSNPSYNSGGLFGNNDNKKSSVISNSKPHFGNKMPKYKSYPSNRSSTSGRLSGSGAIGRSANAFYGSKKTMPMSSSAYDYGFNSGEDLAPFQEINTLVDLTNPSGNVRVYGNGARNATVKVHKGSSMRKSKKPMRYQTNNSMKMKPITMSGMGNIRIGSAAP